MNARSIAVRRAASGRQLIRGHDCRRDSAAVIPQPGGAAPTRRESVSGLSDQLRQLERLTPFPHQPELWLRVVDMLPFAPVGQGGADNGIITPIREPEGRDLLEWEKKFSKQVNKIRAMIERVNANFKTWRIMRLVQNT